MAAISQDVLKVADKQVVLTGYVEKGVLSSLELFDNEDYVALHADIRAMFA